MPTSKNKHALDSNFKLVTTLPKATPITVQNTGMNPIEINITQDIGEGFILNPMESKVISHPNAEITLYMRSVFKESEVRILNF